MTRRISSSRPMTGSILPSLAIAVMSMVNFFRFSFSCSASAVLLSTSLRATDLLDGSVDELGVGNIGFRQALLDVAILDQTLYQVVDGDV